MKIKNLVVSLLVTVLGVILLSGDGTREADASAVQPNELASAMLDPSCGFVNATYVTVPPEGTPNGVYTGELTVFPTRGSTFGILTTGSFAVADDPNDEGNLGFNIGGDNVRGDTDFDVTILRIDCTPAATANCLSLDFAFYSEEFPEFVDSPYNDAFIAELNDTTWSTDGSTIDAPNNFAKDPLGQPVTVNSTGATSVTAENAAGTTYDAGTTLLVASTTFTPGMDLNGGNPGNISLYLSIFDQGDGIYDSAVFVDRIRAGTVNQEDECTEGAQQGEICFDGIDNDGDTLVDGDDPDCPDVFDAIWGDHNCSDQADPVDALLNLRHDAGLSTITNECPEMGIVVEVLQASPHPWGDVDCSGGPDPVDALKILRYDAGLNVSQPEDCPEIGSQVEIEGL
ncbi:MAG TPA: choice-of-anchor L domain-containing protein [Dehalococcoidia bacterium]|nr:choice-of-anchor L domain-containing protein [Dehalococcoidia bacterium]